MLWEEIDKILQKEMDAAKNSLASGAASDYSSYMNSVGRISGCRSRNPSPAWPVQPSPVQECLPTPHGQPATVPWGRR